MTLTLDAPKTLTQNQSLAAVRRAYDKRRRLAAQLTEQDAIIGDVVRTARAFGTTWDAIGAAGGVSEVAAIKAARRLPPGKERHDD